jgi:hypothetical protein
MTTTFKNINFDTIDFDEYAEFDADYSATADAAYDAAYEFDGYDSAIERDFAYGKADLVDLFKSLNI